MTRALEGKTAIVTGAGRLRGIGRAAAVALAGMGANVVVTGTGRDPATFPKDEIDAGWRDIESTAEQIREAGSKALTVVADAVSAADARRVAAATMAEFGRIDILVNNAAYMRGSDRAPLGDLSEDIWDKVIDIKLKGSFLMTQAALPAMIGGGQGGSIVNVSSIAGMTGWANTAAYCTANWGIRGFTLSLAAELAPHKIRVNAICPGLIATSRMDGVVHGEDWAKKSQTIPLRRAGTDEEIGKYIAWVCSPDASYITGQSLVMDGGVVMT